MNVFTTGARISTEVKRNGALNVDSLLRFTVSGVLHTSTYSERDSAAELGLHLTGMAGFFFDYCFMTS